MITGAGSGIGRETARLFLAEGRDVALIGRREDALHETAAGNACALVLPCDVTVPDAVDAAFATAADRFAGLDGLFNNAGTNVPAKTIDEIEAAEWRQVCDVNMSGIFFCARAAFRHMRRQAPQGGRIINYGSVSAQVPRPGSVPYTMSKHAVTGLTKCLALDRRSFGIACGQIDIGNALTSMAQRMTTGVIQPDGSTKVEPVPATATVVSRSRFGRLVIFVSIAGPGRGGSRPMLS